MCSLQEAYNIPSFDPNGMKKKRGTTAPLRETFTDGSMYSSKGATSYNIPASATNAAGYAGRASDNQFYCNNYGICAEKFTAPPPPTQQPQPPAQPTQVPVPGTCGVSAPNYMYPMSDAEKKQYDTAVSQSLNDTPLFAPVLSSPPPMRKVDMNNVGGYYDESLEQYLQTKDFNASAKMPKLEQAPDQQIPLLEQPQPISAQPVVTATKSDKHTYYFDIFLFIAAGILIILLCDQLFRLGMALGIKETVTLLEPYMKKLGLNEEVS